MTRIGTTLVAVPLARSEALALGRTAPSASALSLIVSAKSTKRAPSIITVSGNPLSKGCD